MAISDEDYEKKGYLIQDFRIFRLHDTMLQDIPFHYHDFHKIIFFLKGQADYTIEGKTYPLQPRDIIFVSAGEIHRPLPTPGKAL
jgi:mannose-6-phosphate isomerase-like protein (cupin superfamily)